MRVVKVTIKQTGDWIIILPDQFTSVCLQVCRTVEASQFVVSSSWLSVSFITPTTTAAVTFGKFSASVQCCTAVIAVNKQFVSYKLNLATLVFIMIVSIFS